MASEQKLSSISRLAFLSVVLLCGSLLLIPGGPERYRVGAHYYLWYPGNFRKHYLRQRLTPPHAPALGEYDSRSPAVAANHIALAATHGIDFFVLDWWPSRPWQNASIDEGFLAAPNIDRIGFCILYNSSGLTHLRAGTGIVFDEATKNRFVSDVTSIARRYFHHPSYLRIDGRPVLVLYLTREMRGLYREAIREMRASLATIGYDPFVIGDEIFWTVVEADDDPTAPVRVSSEPQVSRIRLFDAITAYNLYHDAFEQHRGYAGTSRFIADSANLYRRYRKAGKVPIAPGIIPGFNDRGVRPTRDHFAIPRRSAADAAEGSFFAESIERIGKPLVDAKLRMILLTSWNEWSEDTAIEPTAPASATDDDESGTHLYTQGYAYEGFGTTYIDIVRDRLRD